MAIYFSPSSPRIDVPYARATTTVVVSFWAKVLDGEAGDFQVAFYSITSGAERPFLDTSLFFSGELFQGRAMNSTGSTLVTADSLPGGGYNDWSHYCVFYSTNSSIGISLYVNGVLTGSSGGVASPVNTTSRVIVGGSGIRIAELSFWGTLLSTSQVPSLARGFAANIVARNTPLQYFPWIRYNNSSIVSTLANQPLVLPLDPIPLQVDDHPPIIY